MKNGKKSFPSQELILETIRFGEHLWNGIFQFRNFAKISSIPMWNDIWVKNNKL